MKNTPKKKKKAELANSQKTEKQATGSENPISEKKSVQHLLSLSIRPA